MFLNLKQLVYHIDLDYIYNFIIRQVIYIFITKTDRLQLLQSHQKLKRLTDLDWLGQLIPTKFQILITSKQVVNQFI